jgi:acetylornithine deacetylase/succinyl-diaminopimelate desuccinylase-like protein
MIAADAVRGNAELYLGWLQEACAIPSLAGNPEGLERMASWLEARFRDIGADVERLIAPDAPDALLATLGAGDKELLIYDHYDVQPVDPIELWLSDPFAPQIRDGMLYARGVADNKGDLVARLAGIHSFRQRHGELPFRIKFLVEGEEETGSASFRSLVDLHRDKLTADGCIWEGAGIDPAGRGELWMGAKGMAYVELIHRGLTDDQHSAYAVVAPSPVWHLVEAVASLRAPDGRVLIDGFYDDVEQPGDADLALLREFPFDERAELIRFGADEFVGGATGTELVRRYFFEPTCNIAGIAAGFTDRGSKTVLPREAACKIDMRLVPRQDPEDIVIKLRKHLDVRGFDDIEIATHGTEKPVRSPMDSPIALAAIEAAENLFPGVVAGPLMIGTGPMYPIAGDLGIPTCSPVGVCRHDSNIHAPNEHIAVEDFINIAIYTGAWIDVFART